MRPAPYASFSSPPSPALPSPSRPAHNSLISQPKRRHRQARQTTLRCLTPNQLNPKSAHIVSRQQPFMSHSFVERSTTQESHQRPSLLAFRLSTSNPEPPDTPRQDFKPPEWRHEPHCTPHPLTHSQTQATALQHEQRNLMANLRQPAPPLTK